MRYSPYATAVRWFLTGPGCAVGCVGYGVSSRRRDVAVRSVCNGTGIGAARALILWPELVTLGEHCSRWPSWLWPLIIDGAIIAATLGIVALAPYRDQLRNRGFFWVVLGIAALVRVGGNLLRAWLATDQLASWMRAGGETWRQGDVAPGFSCHIAAGCSTRWSSRLGCSRTCGR